LICSKLFSVLDVWLWLELLGLGLKLVLVLIGLGLGLVLGWGWKIVPVAYICPSQTENNTEQPNALHC